MYGYKDSVFIEGKSFWGKSFGAIIWGDNLAILCMDIKIASLWGQYRGKSFDAIIWGDLVMFYNSHMGQKTLDFSGWTLLLCQDAVGAAAGGIKGPTHRDFLQGHLTCDVNLLQDGGFNCLLGAACDLKGRVVASMFIMTDGNAGDADNNRTLLFLPEDSVAPLRELWDKYLLLYRGVTLTPYEGTSNIADIISEPFLQWVDKCADAPANSEAESWNTYLIDRGIAYVTGATAGMMTPQMLGYDKLGEAAGSHVVSFTKGCYLGQEVVARVHYKGKSARLCYRISFAATDLSGPSPCPIFSKVQDKENEVGFLVNHYGKDGRCHGIALLSSNKVDQSNLYINGEQVELA